VEREPAAVERFGIIGNERERFVEARERFGEAFELDQCIAAIAERAGEIRMQREHGIVCRESVAEPTERMQRGAAIGERLHVIGLEANGRFEAGQRFIDPAEVFQRDPPAVMRAGVVLVDAQREPYLAFRGIGAALRKVDDAEQMSGIEMPRMHPQELPADCLGVAQPALLIQGDGHFDLALQRMCSVRRGKAR
jgi:hypothetical protein